MICRKGWTAAPDPDLKTNRHIVRRRKTKDVVIAVVDFMFIIYWSFLSKGEEGTKNDFEEKDVKNISNMSIKGIYSSP